MSKLDTARSRAAETAQALQRRFTQHRNRYVEGSVPERAVWRTLREAVEDHNPQLLHLDADQLAHLESGLKDLRLEADLQVGRARDVVNASTALIDAVIAEQRTR